MNLATVSNFTSRTFSLVSFGLLTLAVVEKLCNVNGYTLVKGSVAPQRMVEYAAVLLMFVLATLLRDVRDNLLKG
jgi:hypothetical protein